MSTALGYIFLVLPVVAVAWILWAYRRRAEEKEARTREREALLLAAPRTPPQLAALERAAPAGAAVLPTPTPAPAPVVAMRRERFLSQPETLAYYLLKAGLPGHEVFPHVSLSSVLAASAGAGGALEPPRPGRHDLDFVVCDKNLRVVAAVRLEGQTAGQSTQWVDQRLAAAGIRLVRVDPAALPKRDQVGALVLGASG